MEEDANLTNLQIFVPEIQVRKCLTVSLDDFVWDVKRKLLATLPQALPQAFNYGLFLPPCDGRAGKFLLEDRTVRDYPFHDCVPYLELKYKKRVYKMLNLDEKQLKSLHTKTNLKKFMDYVTSKNAEKVEKMCNQGLDSNFHDAQGETPLTLAAGIPSNRAVLVSLVGGGAHIDFRNSEGQTAMHKAAFLSSVDNVKTLLELGASPNYRDPIGLTPLYYSMLTADSNDQIAEMLLREAADLGVTDMHGNHEIHQACKNGLVKHVEHLLYFSAEVDAQNVNGNSPLHVCAVNNRPECARVLLFRGANHMLVNKQGQTALHVAHIVNHHGVAEVVQGHNPNASVPYRGTPQYSTRRRLSSTISRRRSLSQSSICSQDIYRTPQHGPRRAPLMAPSPTPSRASRSTVTPSEYGTIRRYAPEMASLAPGHETNTPRILVIPRGPKGFGFILRGAKHVVSPLDFTPSALNPALQFFEGVDMSGMAMKAGLRPGDFLLEIDGIDVRSASHEQVVGLIQQANDTITLKVVTIDPNGLPPNMVSMGGTVAHRRNQSGEEQEMYYAPGGMRNIYGDTRCASVRQRPNGGRRISAAELETLMIRQQAGSAQQHHQQQQQQQQQHYHPLNYEQEPGNQTPKKYNSVSDMKRRKQQRCAPSPQGLTRTYDYQQNGSSPNIYGSPMKNFASEPDIPRMNSFDSFDDEDVASTPLPTSDFALPGPETEYSRPFRPASRPKTPPPPPPQQPPHRSEQAEPVYGSSRGPSRIASVSISVPPPPPPPPPSGPTSSAPAAPPPPPPPPPPPANLFKTSASGASLASYNSNPSSTILASALQNQASNLKKVIPPPERDQDRPAGGPAGGPAGSDFQADLRNALAKRRSKVAHEEDEEDKRLPTGGFSGLSLRESVRETVVPKQHSPPGSQGIAGIANKKDSGYTSSRTSLEPSDSGEDRQGEYVDHSHGHKVTIISQHIEDHYGTRKNADNMSVTSSLSTLSACSSSDSQRGAMTSSSGGGVAMRPNHLPPVDYEQDPDSGTGDSDGEFRNAESGLAFERKDLNEWTCNDVLYWLESLGLGEYRPAFRDRRIDGRGLETCGRVQFTQLGVTRIGHRQIIEASIRQFLNNNNNKT